MSTALDYLRRGWAPVLYPQRSKAPKERGWLTRTYPEEELERLCLKPHNVGVILGARSGGLIDLDIDCTEGLALAGSFLPPTESVFGRASRPRSHRLYRCDPVPAYAKFTDTDGTTLLEVRGDGHQTMFPTSIHPCGETVEWELDRDPAAVDASALLRAASELAAACLLARRWPHTGSRQAAALALAGGLLRGGWEAEKTAFVICKIATVAGDDEPAKRGAAVEHTRRRLDTGGTVQGWPALSGLLGAGVVDRVRLWLDLRHEVDGEVQISSALTDLATDGGNAERFAREHRHELRYCHPWGKWLVWDGRRWTADDGGAVDQMAKATVRAMLSEAATIADEDRRKRAVKHALQSDARNRREAMIALARSEPGIPVQPGDLDRDPWALNVLNGIIDLRTGELRPHDPADLITKLAAVEFAPSAACPRWLRFVAEVLPDPEVRRFVQKALGYCLTGEVVEQILIFCYGLGANGKSVLLSVVLHLLGDYGLQCAPDLLLVSTGEPHPTGLADLAGRRFVATIEVEEGKRLAESLVKWLSGGDTLRARRLYENFWSFQPTHKLVIASNHRPAVKGTDLAIWRRIRLVPFGVTIPEAQRDPRLAATLKAEASGILNWMLDGCLAWQREGLHAPRGVAAATAAYRQEQDVVGRYLGERVAARAGCSVMARDLYRDFKAWCEATGERPMSQTAFGLRLGDRGLTSERRRDGVLWMSMVLLTDPREQCEQFDAISGNFSQETSTRESFRKTTHNCSQLFTPDGEGVS